MSYPLSSSSLTKFQANLSICNDVSFSSPTENTDGGRTVEDGSTEDVEFKGIDSEAKEFNGDFYKLCSIGSLKSLDHFSPAKSQDAQRKYLPGSPYLNKKASGLANFLSNCEKPKPTGLVKPTRPISLVVNSTPQVPEHFESSNLALQNNKNNCASTDTEQNAKTTQVPPNFRHTVFQIQSSPSSKCLPNASDEQNSNNRTPKVKVPTKIIFKTSGSRRRQHSKKDVISERQNHIKEGCGTAWVHLQANPELSDPKVWFSSINKSCCFSIEFQI